MQIQLSTSQPVVAPSCAVLQSYARCKDAVALVMATTGIPVLMSIALQGRINLAEAEIRQDTIKPAEKAIRVAQEEEAVARS